MSAPTEREVAEVEAGVNDPWVDLANTDRHPDPVVAALENDRDLYYARGEYDYAEQAHHKALDEALRQSRASQPQIGDHAMNWNDTFKQLEEIEEDYGDGFYAYPKAKDEPEPEEEPEPQ